MLYFKYDIFMLQKNAYAYNFEMLIKTDNFSITLFSIKKYFNFILQTIRFCIKLSNRTKIFITGSQKII